MGFAGPSAKLRFHGRPKYLQAPGPRSNCHSIRHEASRPRATDLASTLALQTVNNLLSFGVLAFLFAMIFKLLPDTPIRWHNVWLGAVVTALLFTIGKGLLGLYLGRASVTSGYGAARSLIVLLLWCYYAAQIVFLGAEFTRVTALSKGGRDFSPLTEPEQRERSA